MITDPASTVTLCGHPEDRKGHCAVPGCGNRWQLCKDCNPAAQVPLRAPGATK